MLSIDGELSFGPPASVAPPVSLGPPLSVGPPPSVGSPLGVGDSSPSEQKYDLASLNDVAQSVKEQLLVLVEFAKGIPHFNELHLDDKVSFRF